MARRNRNNKGGNPTHSNSDNLSAADPTHSSNVHSQQSLPAMGNFGQPPERAPTPAAPTSASSWATVVSGRALAVTRTAVATPPIVPAIPRNVGRPSVSSSDAHHREQHTSGHSGPASAGQMATSDTPAGSGARPRHAVNLPKVAPAVPVTLPKTATPELYKEKPGAPGPAAGSRPVVKLPNAIPSKLNVTPAMGSQASSIDKAMAEIKSKLDAVKFAGKSHSVPIKAEASSSSAGSSHSRDPRKPMQETNLDISNKKGNETTVKKDTEEKLKNENEIKLKKRSIKILPAELRIKIWKYVMDVPRIIEIEKGPVVRNGVAISTNYPICGNHALRRVAPRSRKPSAVLSVCVESRAEALKVYQLRTFDTGVGEHFIYYNPRADVIYFGEAACVSTMMHLFNPARASSANRDPIPRVAVQCSSRISNCCDWDVPAYGVTGGVTAMQALHGFDESISSWNGAPQWEGCPGLKEVYWVVMSHLWESKPGNIDPDATAFRTPSTNGITQGQKRFREGLLHNINQVENTGLFGVGSNQWSGEDKPSFNFVSLGKHELPKTVNSPGLVHEVLELENRQHRWLAGNDGAAIKHIKRKSGCEVILSRADFPREGREIAFSGSREAVDKAMAEVNARLERMKPLKGKEPI